MKGLKGKIVEVTFLDHVLEGPGEKNDDIMKFKVWGKVQSITPEVISLKTWELQNGDSHTKKRNNEVARILVSTITDIRFLELMPEIKLS